jgi:hypothetical protein
MAAATTSVNGYLTSTDWTTFNNKGSGTVTSVAASVPAFLSISGSPVTTTGTLAITLSGTALPVLNGGTGLTSYTAGDTFYYASGTALTKLTIGAANTVLTSSGTAPQWSTALTLSGSVTAASNLTNTAASMGYTTGAGGTVTQATNKSTAVTLNKPAGQITMNNAALLPSTAVEFSVNNSVVTVNDCINLSGIWGDSPNYRIELKGVFAGGFAVRVTNITAGSLSQALVLNFSVIRGATS